MRLLFSFWFEVIHPESRLIVLVIDVELGRIIDLLEHFGSQLPDPQIVVDAVKSLSLFHAHREKSDYWKCESRNDECIGSDSFCLLLDGCDTGFLHYSSFRRGLTIRRVFLAISERQKTDGM